MDGANTIVMAYLISLFPLCLSRLLHTLSKPLPNVPSEIRGIVHQATDNILLES